MPFLFETLLKSCFGSTQKEEMFSSEPIRVLSHPVYGHIGDTLTPREKDDLAWIASHRPDSPTNRDQSIQIPHQPRLRPRGTVMHRPLEADRSQLPIIHNQYQFRD
jgi:hypothetical protein